MDQSKLVYSNYSRFFNFVSSQKLTVAGTGHRPKHLGGNALYPEILPRLTQCAEAALKYYEASCVISGMALGWDSAIALAALNLNLPLIAAVPCQDQLRYADPRHQQTWEMILDLATYVNFQDIPYCPSAMRQRNEWMVDASRMCIALYNPQLSGGTANCVRYAKERGKPVKNIWSSWQRYKDGSTLATPGHLAMHR